MALLLFATRQISQNPATTRRNGLDAQPATLALGTEINVQIRLRQESGTLLGPFNQTDIFVFEQIPNTDPLQFFRVGEAIQIQVIDISLSGGVGLDQRVSGTLDRPGMAERAEKTAHQRRFSGTQVTMQKHQQPALAGRRKQATESFGGRLVLQVSLKH